MGDQRAWTHNDDGEITIDPRNPMAVPQADQASQRLLTIYEIGQQLFEDREPREVIHTVHRAVIEHLGPDSACILAIGDDGGYRPLSVHAMDLTQPVDHWPMSRTALERVERSGLALLAVKAFSDRKLRGAASVKKHRIQSIVCVPLGSNPVRGFIYASRGHQAELFQPEDLEFLTAVAVYAALALERTWERVAAAKALSLESDRLNLLQSELLRYRIIGRSPRLVAAYDSVRRFARAGAKVLLRGETGTGKELFARAYAACSERSSRAYVPVPLPAMSSTLIDSELFGHAKGAFTGATQDKRGRLELADGGVLFLDEVGDIPLELQVKLLRFLDSGELFRIGDNRPRSVDAYLVSATSRPIEQMIRSGGFRSDLLARLGQVVTLPPLRERLEDIPLLVEHFLEGLQRNRPVGAKGFEVDALELLKRCRWELNLRELHQVVERAVCLVDGERVTAAELRGLLPPESAARLPPEKTYSETVRGRSDADRRLPALKEVVEAVEKKHILRALELCHGNRTRAIELLQLSSETFYRRLKRYGLHQPAAERSSRAPVEERRDDERSRPVRPPPSALP